MLERAHIFRENAMNQARTHLDTSTSQGRRKLLLLALWLCMAMYVLTDNSGIEKQPNYVQISSGVVSHSSFNLIDDEGDDEDGSSSFSVESNAEEVTEEESFEGDSYEDNDEDLLESQKSKLKVTGNKFLDFFKKYRSIKELNTHLNQLMNYYQSLDIISSEKMSQSSSGQDITVYKVGKGQKDQSILVIGLEHAAEWPSMMSITYMITRFVQLYAVNAEITEFLDDFNVYVVPMLNPEGYGISRSSKKLRHFQLNKKRKGADLGLDFGKFSQPETLGLKQWVKDREDIVAFVNVQCCGEAVIIPSLPDCFDESARESILKTGQSMVKTMKDGKIASYKLMQQTNGKKKSKLRKKKDNWSERYAVDWATSELKLKYSYMVEARGNTARKANALDLLPEDIVPVAREITKGILKLGENIKLDDRASQTGCEESVEESIGESVEEEEDEDDLFQTGFESESSEEAYEESETPDTDKQVESGDSIVEDKDEMDAYDETSTEVSQEMTEEYADEQEEPLSMGDDNNEGAETDAGNSGYDDGALIDDDAEASFEDDEDSLQDEAEETQYTEESIDDDGSNHEIIDPNEKFEEERTFLYFAYNHDMLSEILSASGITSARKVGRAKLSGYTMDFTYHSRKTWSSGISDILKQKSGSVYGVVYEVSEAEHALLKQHNLDFSSSRQDPIMRWKKSRLGEVKVSVEMLQTSQVKDCIAFKVKNKMPGKDIFKRIRRFAPSRQYKNCLMRAVANEHFPQEYIDRVSHFNTMLTDKGVISKSKFRNPAIGTICDS